MNRTVHTENEVALIFSGHRYVKPIFLPETIPQIEGKKNSTLINRQAIITLNQSVMKPGCLIVCWSVNKIEGVCGIRP